MTLGGMPRIVSDELFDSVQKIRASRKRLKNYATRNTYLLTGKIFCGNCGSAYCGAVRYSGKRHTPYASYSCGRKQRQAGINCKTKEVRKEYIEEFVLKEILRVILAEDKIPSLVERYREYYYRRISSLDDETSAIRSGISDCEAKIKNLVSVISNSGSKALLTALEECEAEKSRLTAELEATENNYRAAILDEKAIADSYRKAKALFLDGHTEEKRRLVSLYLDKVLVFDDYVEVYVNALPQTIREHLVKKYRNSDTNAEIAGFLGRGDVIRTRDPYVPNVVLYQTEPHLDYR